MSEARAALGRLISVAWAEDRRRARIVLVGYPVLALAGPGQALLLRQMLDAAGGRHGVGLGVAGALLVASVILLQWVDSGLAARRSGLEEAVGHVLERRIAEVLARAPYLSVHEDPDLADTVGLLQADRWWLGRSMRILPAAAAEVSAGLATFALLASVHPVLLGLPVLAVPFVWVGGRGEDAMMRAEEAMAPDLRRAGHLLDLAVSPSAAKELRVFGLVGLVGDRQRTAWRRVGRIYSAAARRAGAWEALTRAVYAAGVGAALGLVAVRVAQHRSAVGNLVLVAVLAGEVHQNLTMVGSIGARLRHAVRAAGRLAELEHATGQSVAPGTDATVEPVNLLLESVSFSYAGAARPALLSVDLELRPGTVTAVVGENGAGKTTLVKLLTRLYEPDQGAIRLGSDAVLETSPSSWRVGCTATFQDFARFELTAAETVGIGQLNLLSDRPAIATALARAGADQVLAHLPEGFDTQLGASWPNGVELSTGQWQRVALARALMRAEPVLAIFDEPASGLDPVAEADLCELIVGTMRGSNRSTAVVIVSHRLSTVRDADVIVVMADAGIVERGSHSELMALEGAYAELYRLQARGYKADTANPN